jgi:cytochrome P450
MRNIEEGAMDPGTAPAELEPWSKIDHHSADFARDCHSLYRRARAEAPVLRSSCHGGFAIVTRHDDIRAVLRDAAHFSSARFEAAGGRLGGGVAIPPNGMRIGIIEMDAPEATQLRKLLAPWFSIAAVEGANARIGQISRWLIERLVVRGECDVVDDLAKPMPTLLILDILGLPLGRWRAYGRVLHEAVAKAGGSMAGLRWLAADLRSTIEAGEYDPEGLIAAFARAEFDRRPIDFDMICELTLMLLFGGADTTIAAICHAVRHLSEYPGDRRRLIEAPAHIDDAIEEILRLHSPSTGVARTVVAPATIAGVRFAPGERVLCALTSGNRDDLAFADSGRFDLGRPRRPHLAFGAGPHACLGQNLARADLRILLTDLLAAMPDFHVDPARTVPYASTPLVNGYAAMPMRFTPRPSEPGAAPADEWPRLTAPRLRPVID